MEIEQVNKKLEILKYLFWSYTQTKSEEYEIDIETSYNPDSTNNLFNFEELSWNIRVTLMCPPEITRISYKLKNAENIIESFFKKYSFDSNNLKILNSPSEMYPMVCENLNYEFGDETLKFNLNFFISCK